MICTFLLLMAAQDRQTYRKDLQTLCTTFPIMQLNSVICFGLLSFIVVVNRLQYLKSVVFSSTVAKGPGNQTTDPAQLTFPGFFCHMKT